MIALTFVPAERSKNCKSDHDHTFYYVQNTKVMIFSNSDVILTVLCLYLRYSERGCLMQAMPNDARLHAFAKVVVFCQRSEVK